MILTTSVIKLRKGEKNLNYAIRKKLNSGNILEKMPLEIKRSPAI